MVKQADPHFPLLMKSPFQERIISWVLNPFSKRWMRNWNPDNVPIHHHRTQVASRKT